MASKDTHSAQAPGEEPPSYQAATSTGGTTSSRPTQSSHLEVPGAKNGIPHDRRRSMEDELRPLPPGWIRQFDAKEGHQFFVDTKANPPRSIWVHPHDDQEYLSTLSSEERERIQEAEEAMHRPLTPASIDEKPHRDEKHHKPSESYPSDLPARPSQSTQGGKKALGERLKDKVTGSTKEERARERAQRAEEERRYYEAHMKFRQALRQSQITGQPQPMGKDAQGHDIYLLPPQNGYGGGYGGYSSGIGGRYIQPSPVYNDPNARFISPPGQTYPGYGRPYGYGGYGGAGLGLPILGGLAGGALLGGLLF